jgi:hypothetical protein
MRLSDFVDARLFLVDQATQCFLGQVPAVLQIAIGN